MALDGRINKLMYKFVDPKDKIWSTFTKQRHLVMAGMATPEDVTGQMIPLIATEKTLTKGNTPLQDFTRGRGATKTIGSTEWTWQLRGSSYRPLIILEDVEPTVVFKGLNKSIFKVKVDMNIPLKGSVLTFEGPKRYQARVQTDPWADGDGYVMELQLMTDDPNMYLPQSLIAPGKLANCMWATYGEASKDDGPTKYMPDAVFKLRSWFSMIRKAYKVTGHAARQKLNNGQATHLVVAGEYANRRKTPTYWANLADIEFQAELAMEKEYVMFYSRSTKSVMDLSSAEVVKQGPGLEELLEDSNIFRYNTFSVNLVEEFLQDLFFHRTSFDQRHILMLTGERGLIQWERGIRDIANGQFSDMSRYFIDAYGMRSQKEAPSLSYGAYYTTYRMFPGGSLTVGHLPILDDPKVNLERDDEGYPIDSSHYYIFDLGLGKDVFDNSNLTYMQMENGLSHWYTCGAYTPKGPANQSSDWPSSHTGDYYSIHHLEHCGMQLTDPKFAGILKKVSPFD